MEESNNKYILQWRECVLKAAKALEEKNFDLYNTLMDEVNIAYEEYKKDSALTYECTNFGMANYIFEDALPTLFKSNKKAVKEFIKTIKEDKNLLYQFQFYKALEKYNKNIVSKDYINEALEIVKNNIDKKTINESNGKLARIITKYNIKPTETIPNKNMGLFESCDFLFKNTKRLTNLTTINENINNVVEFMENNYNVVNEDKINILSLIENFEKKYNSLLNEEEKNFVKEIMDFKKEDKENKKEKLFNKFKNECLETINKLISESDNDDKEGLLAIKEQIMDKTYCAETLVKDMAKLLEIRDILLSE